MSDVPNDRKYLSSHEWARKTDRQISVGITAHAAEELGELVYIDLPAVGSEVTAGESFGEIESVKAVSELNAPVSGKVVEVNSALEGSLDAVGNSPYEEGWMISIEPNDPAEFDNLLDASDYLTQLSS